MKQIINFNFIPKFILLTLGTFFSISQSSGETFLSLEPLSGEAGQVVDVPVYFFSDDPIVGAEFVLKYDPASLKVGSINKGSSIDDHEIFDDQDTEGEIKMTVLSMKNKPLSSGNLTVISFSLLQNLEAGDDNLVLEENALLVSATGETFEYQDIPATGTDYDEDGIDDGFDPDDDNDGVNDTSDWYPKNSNRASGTDHDKDGIDDEFDLDNDNDGFSDLIEIAYGSDPFDRESVANAPPSSIDLEITNFIENLPLDSVVGKLTATDPDENSSISLDFADGNNSLDNQLFTIDSSGNLLTNSLFDYEAEDPTYYIRIVAKDEYKSSTERLFTLQLEDELEDRDSDGIKDDKDLFPENPNRASGNDHDQDNIDNEFDLDDDNDGFSDLSEIAYGSDPLDKDSIANTAPSSIDLTYSNFIENLPLNTVVGQLTAIDPDENSNVSLVLSEGNNSLDNQLFSIDSSGNLLTNHMFDYEARDPKYIIGVLAVDDYNYSTERLFTLELDDLVEDLDKKGLERDFPDLVELGDNWYQSWMGAFCVVSQDWIYHNRIGWLYVHSLREDGMWLYHEELNWLYTADGIYPYFYSNSTQDWLYHYENGSGYIFWDYSTEEGF